MKTFQAPLNWLRKAADDDDGSVSIEFVLVFPLLALWLAASFVWFDAFRAKSQMSKVGYAIADISSRYKDTVTIAQLDNLFDLHKKLLPPRAGRDGWMRVSSICFNTDEEYRVLWSYLGDDTYAAAVADDTDDIEPRLLALTDADIPSLLSQLPKMAVNDTIIFTEVYSYWQPLVSWAGFGATNLNTNLSTRPRFSRVTKVEPPIPGYPSAEPQFCPTDLDLDGDGADDGILIGPGTLGGDPNE